MSIFLEHNVVRRMYFFVYTVTEIKDWQYIILFRLAEDIQLKLSDAFRTKFAKIKLYTSFAFSFSIFWFC